MRLPNFMVPVVDFVFVNDSVFGCVTVSVTDIVVMSVFVDILDHSLVNAVFHDAVTGLRYAEVFLVSGHMSEDATLLTDTSACGPCGTGDRCSNTVSEPTSLCPTVLRLLIGTDMPI